MQIPFWVIPSDAVTEPWGHRLQFTPWSNILLISNWANRGRSTHGLPPNWNAWHGMTLLVIYVGLFRADWIIFIKPHSRLPSLWLMHTFRLSISFPLCFLYLVLIISDGIPTEALHCSSIWKENEQTWGDIITHLIRWALLHNTRH